ncbi:MAG: DUF4168 domain-containing protein [Moorea sp. SIO2B7]|nr:DUF4168 domain-containing protein [Moorena sp. SIO2B7]
MKQLLKGTTVLALLVGTFIGSMPVLAQSQPIRTPIQLAEASNSPLSTEDLQKFANAAVRVIIIKNQALRQIGAAIKNQGFSPERFEAIVKAERSQTALNPALTDDEKQKLAALDSQIKTIEQQAQNLMRQEVEAQSLNPQRFQEISKMVKEDRELRQQVENLIKKQVEELQNSSTNE